MSKQPTIYIKGIIQRVIDFVAFVADSIGCLIGGHSLEVLRKYSWSQTQKVQCFHCGRIFAYKVSGEFAGALLRWNDEWERELNKIERDCQELLRRDTNDGEKA